MKHGIKKHMAFKIVLIIALIIVIFAAIAPNFAPNDPLATDFTRIMEKPSDRYPLGTDQVGRCVYSRILCGARISLGMTVLLLLSISVLGLCIGLVGGMCGGIVDMAIMRISDIVLSFPGTVFAIAIVGMMGPGMLNTIIALSIIWWTKYARLTRILVMEVKSKEYIDAALMVGAGRTKLITYYILPNIISPLIVQFALDIGGMMLTLSGLSFLGLGVQPPLPEWGNMLSEGRAYLQTAPWLLIYPGLAIFIVVAVFNTLGDIVRDVLDPKHI